VIFGLGLVSVTAQAGDNVYRIFESLNNTGLKLTQPICCATTVHALPTHGKAVYDAHWLPLQERLTSAELELLFWLDLVHRMRASRRAIPMRGNRLSSINWTPRTRLRPRCAASDGSVSCYDSFCIPGEEPDPDVRFRLDRLYAWGTTTVYPVVLHLLVGAASAPRPARRSPQRCTMWRVSWCGACSSAATANINRNLLSIVTR